jgi:hypothetical protein
MKLGNHEFGLADVYYEADYGDDFVVCYRWPWLQELMLDGFEFSDPWNKHVRDGDIFVVPMSIYNAAKVFSEKKGYAGMTLPEFVRKFQ